MPAWASGAWASGAWAGTAWQEAVPSFGTAWFANAWAAGAWGANTWAGATGASSGPVITSITAGDTSIVVAWTGTATHYRIDGGTAAAMPDGISPDTITGLTANTEYTIELSGDDGSTWGDPVEFGTLNPGDGGGAFPVITDLTGADAAHGHDAGAATVTSDTALAGSDAAHVHAADAGTVSAAGAATDLTGADADHAHDAGAGTVTSGTLIAGADAEHLHVAGAGALTLEIYLAGADATHTHVAIAGAVSTPGAFPDFLSAFHAYRVPGGADSLVFTVPGLAGALTYRVE